MNDGLVLILFIAVVNLCLISSASSLMDVDVVLLNDKDGGDEDDMILIFVHILLRLDMNIQLS